MSNNVQFTGHLSLTWYQMWNAIEKQILDAFQEISLYVHSAFDSGIGIGVWETRSTTTPFIATHSLYKLPYNSEEENIVVISIAFSYYNPHPIDAKDVELEHSNYEYLYASIYIGTEDGAILEYMPTETVTMSEMSYESLAGVLLEKTNRMLSFLNDNKDIIVQQLSLP